MNSRVLATVTLVSISISGLGFFVPVYADEERARSRADSISEKQDAYDSAKRASEKSPKAFIARKNMLLSYLEVVAVRLAELDEQLRKVNTENSDSNDFLATVTADRTAIADIIKSMSNAKTMQDLASITVRIKRLNVFSNSAMMRAQVLTSHHQVLVTQGVAVLEARMTQIQNAIQILTDEGKDVSTLTIMLTAVREHVVLTKDRLAQLDIERLRDDNRYAENRTELLAIETIIRTTFEELAALSEKGKEIRDAQ